MQKTKAIDKKYFLILLSAFFTAAIFVLFMAVQGVYPFGTNGILRNDAGAQYAPLLREYMVRIKQGSSLLYSFTNGGGTNFYATFCYYLLNPFNLLSLFFSVENFDKAFTFIIFAQTICISASFCFFLIKKFGRNDFSVVAFSLLYTFCGFYMAYYYNTMWLNALVLLPLIALGIEKIVSGKSGWLYFAALAIAIFTNFYMGYMLCIFSVLYFLLLLFSSPMTSKKSENSKLQSKSESGEAPIGKVVLNFGVFSLFAGLVSAVVLIPIYCSLQFSSNKSVYTDNNLFFNILDFWCFHLDGITIPSLSYSSTDTLPNISCGMLSFCLLPLYLFTKKIKLNEKISNAVLLLLLFLSFQIPNLNIIWHGFAAPSGLPYRFAYIYSFLVVLIAYKTFLHIKEVPAWSFSIPVALSVAAIIYSRFSKYSSTQYSMKMILISAVALLVYIGVLLLNKYDKLNTKTISAVLTAAVIVETGASNVGNFITRSSFEEYYPYVTSMNESASKLKETNSSLFYRFENSSINISTPFTGSLCNSYSMSSFSSLNDSKFSFLQFNLGLSGNFQNAYAYSANTAVYNTAFDIKYVLDTNDSIDSTNPYYEKIGEYDGYSLYENKYSSSLGFVCSDKITSFSPDGLSFTNQNNFLTALTGVGNAFDTLAAEKVDYKDCKYVDISEFSNYADENAVVAEHDHDHEHAEGEAHHDLEYNDIIEIANQFGGLYMFKATDNDYELSFTFTAEKDGEMYLNQQAASFSELQVTLPDGTIHTYAIGSQNSLGRYLIDAGYLKAGEQITVRFNTPTKTLDDFDDSIPFSDSVFIEAATMDDEIFKAGYNQIIENGTLNITSFEEEKIEGTVNSTKDGVMMMSMPYDKGWHILVDGAETELVENPSHIMMFNITKGEHTISMKYVPVGLKEGVFVSAASVVALILIALLMNVRKKKEELFPEENPDAEFVKSNKNDDTEHGEDSKE